MRAVLLARFGGVDGLEVRDVAEPALGPNEIKIRMAGASINPIDWKIRSGAYQKHMPLELPIILGRDASGTVEAVGAGVTAFEVGARVLGNVRAAQAEHVVGPADAWAPVPPSLDLADAGALPLVLLTGAQLVDDAVKPDRGDVVLVVGATGSVGRATVFVARARGARVLAGVRGAYRAEAAKLGADDVVAIDDDADIARLPQLDAIADTVGGGTTQKLLGKVKAGGAIGSVVGEPAGARERGLTVRAFLAHPDGKRLAELTAAVAEGRLPIPIARRFPLAEVRKAHEAAEHGAGGKVLLTG